MRSTNRWQTKMPTIATKIFRFHRRQIQTKTIFSVAFVPWKTCLSMWKIASNNEKIFHFLKIILFFVFVMFPFTWEYLRCRCERQSRFIACRFDWHRFAIFSRESCVSLTIFVSLFFSSIRILYGGSHECIIIFCLYVTEQLTRINELEKCR